MYYLVLLLMTIIGAFGGFFLKKASASTGLKALLTSYHFYLGGGLYFASAVLNIIVLRQLPYSVVLPLTSITYIWTAILGYFALKEPISKQMMAGIALILFGTLILVAQ